VGKTPGCGRPNDAKAASVPQAEPFSDEESDNRSFLDSGMKRLSASSRHRGGNEPFLLLVETEETCVEYCMQSRPFGIAALDAARPSWPKMSVGGDEIVCIAVSLPLVEGAATMVVDSILWDDESNDSRGCRVSGEMELELQRKR
jgi:hypothetical protein